MGFEGAIRPYAGCIGGYMGLYGVLWRVHGSVQGLVGFRD